jgi:hypothetical protein
MSRWDPSSIVKWTLPFGLMTGVVLFLAVIISPMLTILAIIVSPIAGWRLSVLITEKDVDHEKLGGKRACAECSGMGDSGYDGTILRLPCHACGGGGYEEGVANADRDCEKCKVTGIMKQGKISRTTCTCVLKNWKKIQKKENSNKILSV